MITWHVKSLGLEQNPLIIFLHGFLGTHQDWIPVAQRLSSHYHCLLVDLPGHGKTNVRRKSDYSFPRLCSSLVKFLVRNGYPHSYLTGYSMGGRIALYLAIHYPQYFKKVILESASPGLSGRKERWQRQQSDDQWAEIIDNMPVRKFLQKWYQGPLFSSLKMHPDFDELISRRITENPQGWSAAMSGLGLGRQPSLWPKLHSLQLPVLILVGEKDEKFRYIALKMKEMNPEFTVSVIPGCGHNIHFENQEKYYQELKHFLTS